MNRFLHKVIFLTFLFSAFLLTPFLVFAADNEVEQFLRKEERLLQERQRAKEFELPTE